MKRSIEDYLTSDKITATQKVVLLDQYERIHNDTYDYGRHCYHMAAKDYLVYVAKEAALSMVESCYQKLKEVNKQ